MTTPPPAVQDRGGEISSKLNWLRAGVLGANDGIVSVAGVVMGVAGASVSHSALLASGVAALVAGAISMAAGEYVSVSTQKDTERAEVEAQKKALADNPEGSLADLAHLLRESGISPDLSDQVAQDLTKKDALGAHARFRLGIDPTELVNPWHAAWASMLAFFLGAIIPLLTMVLAPTDLRIPLTVAATVIALAVTGSTSARLGGAPVLPAVIRVIIGGLLAMGITYAIGALVGTQL